MFKLLYRNRALNTLDNGNSNFDLYVPVLFDRFLVSNTSLVRVFCVRQSFRDNQTSADGVQSGGGGCPVEGIGVQLGVEGRRERLDASTLINGTMTSESRSGDHTTAGNCTARLPARRSQHRDDVGDYDEKQPRSPSSTTITATTAAISGCSSVAYTHVDGPAALAVVSAADNVIVTSCSSMYYPPSSSIIGRLTPESSTSLSSLSTSEIFRRLAAVDARPSRPLQGPRSAVARLFGTPTTEAATVPGPPAGVVRAPPSGPRGRRSLHHSWVRPGRTAFSDTEADSTTVTSHETTPNLEAAHDTRHF